MFGQEIRQARLKAGITQEELAVRAHVTREYVSLLELNKRMPTLPVYVRLCRALGISATKLLVKMESSLASDGRHKHQ